MSSNIQLDLHYLFITSWFRHDSNNFWLKANKKKFCSGHIM